MGVEQAYPVNALGPAAVDFIMTHPQLKKAQYDIEGLVERVVAESAVAGYTSISPTGEPYIQIGCNGVFLGGFSVCLSKS